MFFYLSANKIKMKKIDVRTFECTLRASLSEKFWRISLYLTENTIAKLYVT